jgi:hypothetical protein
MRLTQRQWNHILHRHDYMGIKQWVIQETLAAPQEVHKSPDDSNTVNLYYRWYGNTPVGGRRVCVVVKFLEDDAFILPAYETDRLTSGALIWPIEF